jgi:hypothetical protein
MGAAPEAALPIGEAKRRSFPRAMAMSSPAGRRSASASAMTCPSLLEEDELVLRLGVKGIIQELDSRGILQSIARKNDGAAHFVLTNRGPGERCTRRLSGASNSRTAFQAVGRNSCNRSALVVLRFRQILLEEDNCTDYLRSTLVRAIAQLEITGSDFFLQTLRSGSDFREGGGRSGFIRRDFSPHPNLKRWYESMKKLKAWAKVHEVFYGFVGSIKYARFEAV